MIPAPASNGAAGAYVHLPFCRRRCSYCDFAIAVGQERQLSAYVTALVEEIGRFQLSLGDAIDSLYIGGGTPSLAPAAEIARVVGALRSRSTLPLAEVTLEANPEDLDASTLDAFAAAGVTRLSLGLQSLDTEVLQRVGRLHDGPAGLAALRLGKARGLDVSVDLIVGLPGEQLDAWPATVERVLEAGPDHLSLYTLEIDKPTPLARAVEAGRSEVPRGEPLVEAFFASRALIERAGLEAYELASFARPGKRCLHNLKYWNDAWYGGFGLGAHGYSAGGRRGNVEQLDRYLERIAAGEDPLAENDPWDPARRLEEAAICGLRNRSGLDLTRLAARYGVAGVGALEPVWRRAAALGRVDYRAENVRFTEPGLTAVDEVLAEIVGNPDVASALAPGD